MKGFLNFLNDESGQAVTEYALFISVLVVAVFAVGFAFKALLIRLIENQVGQSLLDKFFNPQSMHRFPFRLRS